MYNSAIIGCGAISAAHAEALGRTQRATLRAVADIRSERAEKLAQSHGCEAYSDYKDILSDKDIQVVHICTPHYLHPDMAVNAMKAGKHVVIEKPVAISREGARAILDTQKQTGMKACVCFQNRYNPTSVRMKSFLSSGKAGRILGAKASVTWFRDADYYTSSGWRGKMTTEGGGVLINQAIHTLDLLLWLLGDVEEIDGKVSTRLYNKDIDVENSADVLLSFKGGHNALLYATTCFVKDSPVEIEIWCENAVLKLSDGLTISCGGEVECCSDKSGEIEGKAYWGSSHFQLIDEFYARIEDGGEVFVTPYEGYKALNAVLTVYESSRKGCPVRYEL
ncbi:MAG: Gfo/Idh/MocA family protein [Eubacteriales bacterium]